ncbi:hypothetical protein [Aureispira anguillae]|uniref:Uncharacterized protein n=1 Tax=Aureispira anguillae TaxID=2864201 RepID=A0A916DXY0_9BACT|nr:hypothetical protein [Aureispira anguillae]BDS15506.1 hypothetical protein AsAng_0062900 [Aureispira anguillae]
MRYLLHFFLLLYCTSFFFPFANGWLGYELEFEMWNDMLNDNIPDMNIATIWSIRWLVNVLLLGIYWLRIPEIHTWISLHADKNFLNKLLMALILLLVAYPFVFEAIPWNWGGILWASTAILAGGAYLISEIPVQPEVFYSLEEHLVELKEEH